MCHSPGKIRRILELKPEKSKAYNVTNPFVIIRKFKQTQTYFFRIGFLIHLYVIVRKHRLVVEAQRSKALH